MEQHCFGFKGLIGSFDWIEVLVLELI